jgi:hypothetical protein
MRYGTPPVQSPVVKLAEPLEFGGGLAGGPFPLAALPGHARRLQKLLLILPEPLVLPPAIVFQRDLLPSG